jgi:hypothetical protein
MESGLGPETALYRTVALSFVIPSEAEGSAVRRTFRGDVFRQSVAERRDLRFSFWVHTHAVLGSLQSSLRDFSADAEKFMDRFHELGPIAIEI